MESEVIEKSTLSDEKYSFATTLLMVATGETGSTKNS